MLESPYKQMEVIVSDVMEIILFLSFDVSNYHLLRCVCKRWRAIIEASSTICRYILDHTAFSERYSRLMFSCYHLIVYLIQHDCPKYLRSSVMTHICERMFVDKNNKLNDYAKLYKLYKPPSYAEPLLIEARLKHRYCKAYAIIDLKYIQPYILTNIGAIRNVARIAANRDDINSFITQMVSYMDLTAYKSGIVELIACLPDDKVELKHYITIFRNYTIPRHNIMFKRIEAMMIKYKMRKLNYRGRRILYHYLLYLGRSKRIDAWHVCGWHILSPKDVWSLTKYKGEGVIHMYCKNKQDLLEYANILSTSPKYGDMSEHIRDIAANIDDITLKDQQRILHDIRTTKHACSLTFSMTLILVLVMSLAKKKGVAQ